MTLSPPSYVRTPHVAYVDFRIAGVSITKPNGNRPDTLTHFSYSRQVNEAGEFELDVFDKDWTNIETLAINHNEEVEFTYGYEPPMPGDVNSPVWTGKIISVVPSFQIDGVALKIKGIGNLADANLIKKSKSWPDYRVDGEDVFKRISDYVEDIAKRHGWQTSDENGPTVDKTLELKTHDSFAGTEKVNMRFIQQRMTDLQFIRQILVPHAVREKDKVSGYCVDLVENDGKMVLHFHPPRRDNPLKRVFIFMRDPQSEVINFEVDHDGTQFVALKGMECVAIPLVDPQTGEFTTKYIKKEDIPKNQHLADQIVKQKKVLIFPTIQAFPFITRLPAKNEEIAKAMASQKCYAGFNTAVNARLTIVGDDRNDIWPQQVCKVVVQTNSGGFHYTSGKYLIIGKTDEITNGIWTSTLQLTREGFLFSGDDEKAGTKK